MEENKEEISKAEIPQKLPAKTPEAVPVVKKTFICSKCVNLFVTDEYRKAIFYSEPYSHCPICGTVTTTQLKCVTPKQLRYIRRKKRK